MVKEILLADQHFHDLNPIICGHQECEPNHAFGPSTRFYWLLHYVVQGSGIFVSGNQKYEVRAGQIFVIRPYEVTYYEADGKTPWEYIWVGFTSGLDLSGIFTESVMNAGRCGNIFSSILEAERMNEGRELFLCGMIYQLLARLSEKHSGEEDYVEQARTFLESHYMQEVSIVELAERMNLNRSYFSTLFRRKTGKSPQQYLTDFRMEKACELMTEHGYSPGEAALSTGYPDIFSFSRMFKRYMGVSPREYKRMHPKTGK